MLPAVRWGGGDGCVAWGFWGCRRMIYLVCHIGIL